MIVIDLGHLHITIDPCVAGASDDQFNDIFLLQGNMFSFNMEPTEILTGIYITRYNAPKLVSEHMGHAVFLSITSDYTFYCTFLKSWT